MTKSIIVFQLLFFATTISLFAQNIDLPTEYIRNSLNDDNDVPANVEGSPYLHQEFKRGMVKVGDKSFSTFLRYNGLLNVFEIKNEQNEIITLLRRPDISVEIDNTEHKIASYRDENGNIRQGYLKFLYSGKISFLKKEGVLKIDARKASNSYGRDKPARLEPFEKYYIKKESLPAEEVRLRRKDILRAIDNEKVTDFVKKKKLKLKEESEIIQTLNFHETIQ